MKNYQTSALNANFRNYNLNITYCLQDEDWNESIIRVSNLDDAHSKAFSFNTTEASFSLTIEGLNRGKSDLVICNVSETNHLSMSVTLLDTTETPEISTTTMRTTPTDQGKIG